MSDYRNGRQFVARYYDRRLGCEGKLVASDEGIAKMEVARLLRYGHEVGSLQEIRHIDISDLRCAAESKTL